MKLTFVCLKCLKVAFKKGKNNVEKEDKNDVKKSRLTHVELVFVRAGFFTLQRIPCFQLLSKLEITYISAPSIASQLRASYSLVSTLNNCTVSLFTLPGFKLYTRL